MESSIDNSLRIVVSKPNIQTLNRARRWLRGAAALLADASNGDRVVEKLACEASTLSVMTEIIAREYGE
jgi:hypothetical protein